MLVICTNLIAIYYDSNWWPLFVIIFYVLSPLPTVFARRYSDDMNTSSALRYIRMSASAATYESMASFNYNLKWNLQWKLLYNFAL